MSSHPDVSIIIPCYNRSDLVGEAIESALRQGPAVEVVVVDDGSTDASWDVISSFAGLKAARTDNRGVSAARNEGIRLSTGRFIKFLDSDDTLPDESVVRMLDATASLTRREIAVGSAVIDGSAGGRAVTYGYTDRIAAGKIPGPLLLRYVMPCGLPLFRREVLVDSGGFDENLTISEDYELAARLHAQGYEFVQIPIPAYTVRDHHSARLSRRYGASGYAAQLRALQRVSAAITSAEERKSLGMVAWTLGRNASREQFQREAEALFAFALEVGGPTVRVGTMLVQLLYNAFRPYTVERLVEQAKAAFGR